MRVLACVALAALTFTSCSDSNPAQPSTGGATGSTDAVIDSAPGGRPIAVDLTGAAERPGPGDPDGTGTAAVTFNPGQGRVCWELTWSGIADPFAAHIHVAPVTDPGPVVIPLSPIASGCTSADRDLIRAILTNPEGYYVNVHNADFPGGAIRAQLK